MHAFSVSSTDKLKRPEETQKNAREEMSAVLLTRHRVRENAVESVGFWRTRQSQGLHNFYSPIEGGHNRSLFPFQSHILPVVHP